MFRILIADAHPVVRRGIRSVVEDHPSWEVCGETGNGREAVELAVALGPEAAVLDLWMPLLNGLETTRRISRELPRTSVLLFCERGSEELAADAIAAGARGCLFKDDPTEDLVAALEALSQGGTFFARSLASARLGLRRGPLTPREQQIVGLIAEGRRTRDIAGFLGISEKTVETHRGAAMRKQHLSNLAEVVRYAIRNKLARP